MTDNEVLQALDSVGTANGVVLGPHSGQADIIADRFRELISKNGCQKAEIERLKNELMKSKLEKEMLYHVGIEIKTVAIKEFAERLKKRCSETYDEVLPQLFGEIVDEVVKEMTEESE